MRQTLSHPQTTDWLVTFDLPPTTFSRSMSWLYHTQKNAELLELHTQLICFFWTRLWMNWLTTERITSIFCSIRTEFNNKKRMRIRFKSNVSEKSFNHCLEGATHVPCCIFHQLTVFELKHILTCFNCDLVFWWLSTSLPLKQVLEWWMVSGSWL